jgi:hypothetical protein
MATHFRWYGAESRITVPWNATYDYPSQANKTTKSTPRLTPKNGSTYQPGDEIRIELPAQGYLNPGNTTLVFDVDLIYTPAANDGSIIRFQDNIQSLFQRVRLMYGSTPLEDIVDYNLMVRKMTQWTASEAFDQASICDGIGGAVNSITGGYGSTSMAETAPYVVGPVNARQKYVQGIGLQTPNTGGLSQFASRGFGIVPNGGVLDNAVVTAGTAYTATRRYTVQLALGIMQQGKYLPIKFMASQLAILINLAPAKDCIIWHQGKTLSAGATPANSWIDAYNTTTPPTYQLRNVALLPEILEFDSSYDQSILEGLKSGIPIKFATWDTFRYAVASATQSTFQIPERARSVKSIYALQVRSPTSFTTDSGASFFTSYSGVDFDSSLIEFQYRIGGRYFKNLLDISPLLQYNVLQLLEVE